MKFRVFLVLSWKRMWLESFLCLKGRSAMSSELKTLDDNPFMSQFAASGV